MRFAYSLIDVMGDVLVTRQGSGISFVKMARPKKFLVPIGMSGNPGHEPTVLTGKWTSTEVYSANITHNLNKMADAAGIYKHLWQPTENGIIYAEQLIAPLTEGLANLRGQPCKIRSIQSSEWLGQL